MSRAAKIQEDIQKIVGNKGLEPGLPPTQTKVEEVEGLFFRLSELVKESYPFTADQMDVGIKMSWSRLLSDHDQNWFREVAELICHRPWCQVLWGFFRRCNDWGYTSNPAFDPGWSDGDFGMLKEIPCGYCGEIFKQEVAGQIYCSNKHGAAAEFAMRNTHLD